MSQQSYQRSKEILQRNPKLKAGLTRGQHFLRSWIGTEAWAELCERFGDQLDELNADLRATGFDPPGGDLDNWAHLARVIEHDPDLMKDYQEIRDWALAWAERERLKARFVADVTTTPLPPQPKSGQVDVESAVRDVNRAMLDEMGLRILRVAQSADSTNDKLQEIYRLDQRFVGKTSDEMADLLGVTAPAVRQTDAWRVTRKRLKRD